MIGRRIAAGSEGGSQLFPPHYQRNVEAYLAQKGTIDQTYPKGRFVGIYEGRIVADGATLDELLASIRALGLDPRAALTVQAGDDYPRPKGLIFWGQLA
jgi:hypothetical protein